MFSKDALVRCCGYILTVTMALPLMIVVLLVIKLVAFLDVADLITGPYDFRSIISRVRSAFI